MAGAYDLAQPFYDCIPQENRNKLDRKVDADHDGVQIHLGTIANCMDEWEGNVADALGLSRVDVANIKSRHRDNLSLQARAALQKWQEKLGFQSTYRNLIVVFLKVGKTSYAEAVCRVLGGDPSQIRATPSRMYASMPPSGVAAQGTRLRTNPHYHDIYYVLIPYADQWRAIGGALGFFPNELNIIGSNPMLLMQGPSGYLGEMLTRWLQWAPGDGRRSRNFATFEDLRDAILKVPSIASLAYDLGPALGIQGGTVPPPQPPSTNVHAAAHPYASMPAGLNTANNLPQYPQQPPTLASAGYEGGNAQPRQQSTSSISVEVGSKTSPDGPPVNNQECDPFLMLIKQGKIVERDRRILEENGITCNEAFIGLNEQELLEMTDDSEKKKKLSKGCINILKRQLPPQNTCDQKQVPGRRVDPDSDPTKETDVMDQIQKQDETDYVNEKEPESTPLPELQPANQNQPSLPEPEGPWPWTRHPTSYSPYSRELKGKTERTMKHTPKLKLESNPGDVMEVETCPVQRPSSLPGLYQMKNKVHGHGVALIINNENFDADRHKKRNGTNRDEENVVETFRFLGYRVEIRRDCKKEDIESLFDNIDSLIKNEDDSFICCILSHGCANVVYGSDSNQVLLRTKPNSLEKKLGEKCPRLNGKPKIFFLSTCRQQNTVTRGSQTEPELEGDTIIPRADFVFCFATLPGEAATRYPDTGNIYIRKLCHVVCKNATKATLYELHLQVTRELKQGSDDQVPAFEGQMDGGVYFFDDMFK